MGFLNLPQLPPVVELGTIDWVGELIRIDSAERRTQIRFGHNIVVVIKCHKLLCIRAALVG